MPFGSRLFTLGGLVSASAFSPSDIASIYTWHKADALSLAEDAQVSAWLNSQGTAARDLFQSGFATNNPLFKTAPVGFNGKPAVYFDGHATDGGGSKQLYWGNVFSTLTVAEVFIVAKLDNDPPLSTRNVGFWRFGTANGDSMPWTDGILYDAFGTDTRKTTVNPAESLASSFIYNVTSKSGGWTSRLNGTQLFTTASNTVAFTTDPRLGFSQADTFIKGHIAEVILYGAELSSANRTSVKNHLSTKYNITVA